MSVNRSGPFPPGTRKRGIVNACWNCRYKASTDPVEHECESGLPYCLMDGCNVEFFNICKNWEKSK